MAREIIKHVANWEVELVPIDYFEEQRELINLHSFYGIVKADDETEKTLQDCPIFEQFKV